MTDLAVDEAAGVPAIDVVPVSVPPNEADRLAAVRRYDVLDTPPDEAFDRITALAARLLKVPIAIVSIVDTDRIWFKSHHGLDVEQVDREPGLCASAILGDGPWLVTDALADPRSCANTLVTGEFGLRFYAAVPLQTYDGFNLGSLCVLDTEPREITPEEVATLGDLGALVMDELELRLSSRRAVDVEAALRGNAEDVAQRLQESLLPPALPQIPGLDIAAGYHVANRDQAGGDFYDVIETSHGCVVVVGDACGKGTRAVALAGAARWTLRTLADDLRVPADALRRLNEVLVRAYDDPEQCCTVALASFSIVSDEGVDGVLALAGHPPPILLHTDGTIEHVGISAPAAGWLAETTFTDVKVRLRTGDVLVLFTDGMADALGGHGSTDDSPVIRLLSTLAGNTASEVAAAVSARLAGKRLRDDAAFLVVRCAATNG